MKSSLEVEKIPDKPKVESVKKITLDNITASDLIIVDPTGERYIYSKLYSSFGCDGCQKKMSKLEPRFHCNECENYDLCLVCRILYYVCVHVFIFLEM
jgi:hypothetical protein